jgi:hypothetical protein
MPANGDLQRRARAQSRQLRVLFDQATVFDHVLMRQLRPSTDDAAARGVDAVVDVVGELPDLTDGEIAGLVAPLAQVLQAATSAARVVLTTSDGEVTASIVGEQIDDVDRLTGRLTEYGNGTDLVVAGRTVWLLVRHRSSGSGLHAETA